MTEYRRSKPQLGVSVERGTENVPDDGRFHVLVDGEIVLSTRVQSAADLEFDEQVHSRLEPTRQTLARESAHFTMQAVRSDSFERRAAKSRKPGGRGGRGGV